jgi:hypothetical protein
MAGVGGAAVRGRHGETGPEARPTELFSYFVVSLEPLIQEVGSSFIRAGERCQHLNSAAAPVSFHGTR